MLTRRLQDRPLPGPNRQNLGEPAPLHGAPRPDRNTCPDWATLEKCVEAIRVSDERLRARPDELMLWDWDTTWVQFDNQDNPMAGGGLVFLGVAWYSPEFFDERSGAWFGMMHKRIYQQIGVPLGEVTVQHFLAAERAAWKPQLQPSTT